MGTGWVWVPPSIGGTTPRTKVESYPQIPLSMRSGKTSMPPLGRLFFRVPTPAPRSFFLGVQRRLEPAPAGGRFEDRFGSATNGSTRPTIGSGSMSSRRRSARIGQDDSRPPMVDETAIGAENGTERHRWGSGGEGSVSRCRAVDADCSLYGLDFAGLASTTARPRRFGSVRPRRFGSTMIDLDEPRGSCWWPVVEHTRRLRPVMGPKVAPPPPVMCAWGGRRHAAWSGTALRDMSPRVVVDRIE